MKKHLYLSLLLATMFCSSCSETEPGDGCDYQGSKCNAEGTALLTCTNGIESTKLCPCSNNQCVTTPNPQDSCDYQGSKCNAEGTALLTCTNGVESSKACSCSNNQCVESPNPSDSCDYQGSKCNTDGTALLTCTNGVESSKACECSNDQCVESPNPSDSCDYQGSKCNADGTALLTCTNGEETSELCYCEDNKCRSSSEEKCTFNDRCDDTRQGVQKCVSGKVEYEACHTGEICNVVAGVPKCEAMATCDNFKNYCTMENGKHVAVQCSENTAIPFKKTCSAICLNGECTSNKTFDAPCNPDGQWTGDICIGNKIATCHNNVVKLADDGDCEADGLICGMLSDGILATPECYESCKQKGQIVHQCISTSDINYSVQYECVAMDEEIGDGRLGYAPIQGTWNACDFECKDGKCVDYTEGILDAGKPCTQQDYKGYCKTNALAVTCAYNEDANDYIVEVEKCFKDEVCWVKKWAIGSIEAMCAETLQGY